MRRKKTTPVAPPTAPAVTRKATPPRLSRQDIEDINVELAAISVKLDGLPEVNAKVDALAARMAALEIFQAQMQVWGVVGGALWSIILTLISIKVWA